MLSPLVTASDYSIQPGVLTDMTRLCAIEQQCFANDRLSRRSFKHWISSSNGIVLTVKIGDEIQGYSLTILHRGIRNARLYSVALMPTCQGKGIGKALMLATEAAAAERGRVFLRLEVAKHNLSAIRLYENLGYKKFGEYKHYYEDNDDALRMQKRIKYLTNSDQVLSAPWYWQTTEFTCGPASLMMAMAALDPSINPNRSLELSLWREATTIFMTSGHGGCHPIGLALAALHRGFATECYLSTDEPLFVNGVRSEHKKTLLRDVHNDFVAKAKNAKLTTVYEALNLKHLREATLRGEAVLVLISTYRLDRNKSPHWVLVTAVDDECLYVHDPDVYDDQQPLDCQHAPIAITDFEQMSSYGSNKLRAAVIVKR